MMILLQILGQQNVLHVVHHTSKIHQFCYKKFNLHAYVPVKRWGNLTGRITASLRASLAICNPATSSHFTLGFSITIAPVISNQNFIFIFNKHWVVIHEQLLVEISNITIWQMCSKEHVSPAGGQTDRTTVYILKMAYSQRIHILHIKVLSLRPKKIIA